MLGYPQADLERLHAVTLARIGRFAEAEPILLRLYQPEIKPDPNLDEALARLYLMTYRLRQAEQVIRQWMRDAPRDARPYLWLTEYDRRMEVDNLEALETHYRAALERDKNLDAARLGLAETLRKAHAQRRRSPRIRDLSGTSRIRPRRALSAGLNDLARGDLESAARRLDRALEIDGRDAAALKGRAEIDTALREPKKALERLDRALEVDPFDTETLYSRGRIRALLGDAAGSKQDLESFKRYTNDHENLLELRGHLMANPNDNSLRVKVAAWMFAHGRDADGLGWAKAVLASDPDHAETNSLLAGYYSERPSEAGLANYYRLRLAETMSAAMIHRLLKNPYALGPAAIVVVVLGWVSYRALSERQLHAGLEEAAREMEAGNPIEARDRLARLAHRWPGQAEILFRLGESELACGRIEQAMIAWSEVPHGSPLAGRAAVARAAGGTPDGPIHRRRASFEGCARRTRADYKRAAAPAPPDPRPGGEARPCAPTHRGTLVRQRTQHSRAAGSGPRTHRTRPGCHAARGEPGFPRSVGSRRIRRRRALANPSQPGYQDRAARRGFAMAGCRPDALGDDPAVWRARLEWARAAGRLDRAGEAMAHLDARDFSQSEITRLRAWIAERNGDITAEKHALEQTLAHNPGDLAALERLAELAFRQGRVDEGRQLRNRKSELDLLKDRYQRLFKENQLEANAMEMACLAAALGRDFEARAFLTLLEQKDPRNPAVRDLRDRLGPPPPPRSVSSDSLAKLFAGTVGRIGRATPASQVQSTSVVHFEDDAGSAGLGGFVFDNGTSPSRQLPETFSAELASSTTTATASSTSIAIQGGRFPPAEPAQRTATGFSATAATGLSTTRRFAVESAP